MSKQKIVLKVQMNCDKCRSKALQIAAVTGGVISVGFGGGDKNDQVVVTGVGVDSVSLTSLLRKKVGHATIVSIEQVKEKNKDKEKEKEKEKKIEVIDQNKYWGYNGHCSQFPRYYHEVVVYDSDPPGCSIM